MWFEGTVEGPPFNGGRQDTYAVRFDDGELRDDVRVESMKILPGQRMSMRAGAGNGAGAGAGAGNGSATSSAAAAAGGECESGTVHAYGEVQYDANDLHYRGWMYKHKDGLLGGWALRWFVLTPNGTLISCKSDKPKHASGTRRVRLVSRNWTCEVKPENYTMSGHRNIMSIVHRDPKSKVRGFVLSTLTNQAKTDWTNAMKNYVPIQK
jgi:hypothetical protein